MLRRPLLLLLTLFLTLPAPAQEADGAARGAAETGEPAQEPGGDSATQLPTTPAEAMEVDESDLREAAGALDREALEALLGRWMGWIESEEEQLRTALDAPEGSPERDEAVDLRSDRDALVDRAWILADLVEGAGGSAEAARERLDELLTAAVAEFADEQTLPEDRAEASTLSIEILRAKLRPLTREQVEEQLPRWLDVLREKSLEVRNVEVAALSTDDPDAVERLNERAVDLRGQRGRLIDRVTVVVDALEEKNGDVADVRAYLDSIVVTPPISGWRAAWTTARAWLVSDDGGIALALRLVRALGILVVFVFLSILAGRIARRAMRSVRSASSLLSNFVVTTARRGVLFVGLLLAVGQLGVNMGPLLAMIGAAGLVIGLALQGTLSNFASGLLIMIYRPFDVGDVANTAGVTGTIEGMTLMTTRLRTFDNRALNIPNNKVWGDVITNLTAHPTRRVDMVFGISYGDDVDRAREVLLDVLRSHESVLDDPEPMVQVNALGDSSVDFVVRPWVRTEDYWAVYWDLHRAVKRRLDEEGITIPFPQRDVHFFPASGAPADAVAASAAGPERGGTGTAAPRADEDDGATT